jgi:hypothetical protein
MIFIKSEMTTTLTFLNTNSSKEIIGNFVFYSRELLRNIKRKGCNGKKI